MWGDFMLINKIRALIGNHNKKYPSVAETIHLFGEYSRNNDAELRTKLNRKIELVNKVDQTLLKEEGIIKDTNDPLCILLNDYALLAKAGHAISKEEENYSKKVASIYSFIKSQEKINPNYVYDYDDQFVKLSEERRKLLKENGSLASNLEAMFSYIVTKTAKTKSYGMLSEIARKSAEGKVIEPKIAEYVGILSDISYVPITSEILHNIDTSRVAEIVSLYKNGIVKENDPLVVFINSLAKKVASGKMVEKQFTDYASLLVLYYCHIKKQDKKNGDESYTIDSLNIISRLKEKQGKYIASRIVEEDELSQEIDDSLRRMRIFVGSRFNLTTKQKCMFFSPKKRKKTTSNSSKPKK